MIDLIHFAPFVYLADSESSAPARSQENPSATIIASNFAGVRVLLFIEFLICLASLALEAELANLKKSL